MTRLPCTATPHVGPSPRGPRRARQGTRLRGLRLPQRLREGGGRRRSARRASGAFASSRSGTTATARSTSLSCTATCSARRTSSRASTPSASPATRSARCAATAATSSASRSQRLARGAVRRPALPPPGGPRHRPAQQGPRVLAAGQRPRHRRRQPRARLPRRRARLRDRRAHAREPRRSGRCGSITNNPKKVRQLEQYGIRVSGAHPPRHPGQRAQPLLPRDQGEPVGPLHRLRGQAARRRAGRPRRRRHGRPVRALGRVRCSSRMSFQDLLGRFASLKIRRFATPGAFLADRAR